MSDPTTSKFVEDCTRRGAARIPQLAGPEAVRLLKSELYTLIRAGYEAGQRVAAFDKVDGSHDRDPLFLDSGLAATVFHEPVARTWPTTVDLDEYTDAVARVGHGLHARPGAVRNWLNESGLGEWSRLTGRRRPAVIETMFVRKSRWSENLPPHLDHTYLWTDPPSVQVFWLALDRADERNGGLLVDTRGPVPGPRHRLVRHGDEAKLVPVVDAPTEAYPFADLAALTPVRCDPGDAVVVDGLVLHGSGIPEESRGRDALAVHVVDLECAWASTNYLGNMTPYEL